MAERSVSNYGRLQHLLSCNVLKVLIILLYFHWLPPPRRNLNGNEGLPARNPLTSRVYHPSSSSLTDVSFLFPASSLNAPMTGLSPTRGLRTNTSDVTDCFRVGYHRSTQPRPISNDLSTASSMTLEVSGQMKKRMKIPFFGRTRKKSNQSGALRPYASTGACGSTDVTELPSSGGQSIHR